MLKIKTEPIWFNENMRKEIKNRKEYNRGWKNSKNETDEQSNKDLYLKQK